MALPEVPQQYDLFTGELVAPTPGQMKKVLALGSAKQPLLFSQREIAQFGVKARPLLPIAPATRLELFREDPCTPEEIAQDVQREAESLTSAMFPPAETLAEPGIQSEDSTENASEPSGR